MESPFDVLRVEAGADDEEIKRAYRERVKEAHPDRGGSAEEFKRVRRAYERLKAGYRENGNRNGDGRDVVDDRSDDATDRRGDATDRSDGEDGGEDATADRARRVTSAVGYLNYEVLADFGWSIDDEALFERAADADLDEDDYGEFEVQPGESLLEAAEERGYVWPFACRGGACANCAVFLLEGELSMPVSHVLPEELMARGFRLSCNGMPITEELKVVYNVKHMPELEELLLPPDPFEQAYPDG